MGTGFFCSAKENSPWLQLQWLHQTVVTAVSLTNRADCCGDRLKDVQIRAGTTGIVSTHLNVNDETICGTFDGPGENGKEYIINCTTPILANFITVQLMSGDQYLQINELQINPSSGKLKVAKPHFNIIIVSKFNDFHWQFYNLN